jgi:branched-chain amino acid transport system substrate-binding protein
MMMHRLAGTIICVAALLFGCNASKEPVRIGYTGEFSGNRVTPSIYLYRGIELAVDRWNKAGGIKGRPVELIIRDDQGLPEEAIRVDRELIALGVEALLGHPLSTTSLAVIDLVNEAELVSISPTATSELLREKDDFFFTMFGGNRERAAAIARFAVEKLESRRIAVLLDASNAEYTDNYFTLFQNALENSEENLVITDIIRYSSGAPALHEGFESLVKALLENNPDTVLALGSSIDTAKVLQQLYKMGKPLPVLISEWASNMELIDQGGPYVENVYFSDISGLTSDSPAVTEMEEAFSVRYSEEATISAKAGYEAADVLFQALNRAGKGGEKLKKVLIEGSFSTISGTITFSPSGDADREMVIKTVEDGNFVCFTEQ